MAFGAKELLGSRAIGVLGIIRVLGIIGKLGVFSIFNFQLSFNSPSEAITPVNFH
jgi:hypothetical protein